MPRANLAVVPDLERELDVLYGLPLGEFTSARNELARRLRKAGQTSEAESVARLAKPAISAWAVNRVARVEADGMRELLAAGQEIVDAQREALAGGGTERFDEASRRQRDAVRALQRAAGRVLEEAGHRPTDAVKERIASSLRAASMDPEGRALLERGRLAEDFESAGLGLLAGLAPSGTKPARKPRSDGARREAKLREARARLDAAREEEQRLSAEADAAEREAEQAREAAEAAAERARAAAAEAAGARDRVETAKRALAELDE